MNRIEAQIENETCQRRNKYTRPVAAFVIFANQENKERVLSAYGTTTNFYNKPVFKK